MSFNNNDINNNNEYKEENENIPELINEDDFMSPLYDSQTVNPLLLRYNMFDDLNINDIFNDIDIESLLSGYSRNRSFYTTNIITNFIINELENLVNSTDDDDYDRILNESFESQPQIERNKSPINFQSQTYEEIENDNKECSICLVLYESNDMVSLTKCKHLFHTSCIEECSRYKYECPVCRQNLN
jgi:hypothetical protein